MLYKNITRFFHYSLFTTATEKKWLNKNALPFFSFITLLPLFPSGQNLLTRNQFSADTINYGRDFTISVHRIVSKIFIDKHGNPDEIQWMKLKEQK